MDRLLNFYAGSGIDHRGRYLTEILEQRDSWLESEHDFIQWLFPLREPSGVLPDAPLLSPAAESAFNDDSLLRGQLLRSFRRMLRFYGLRQVTDHIEKSSNWLERKPNWFIHPTHNNLRITRILKSMTALGLGDEARSLLDALLELAATESDCGVGETALRFWVTALNY